MLNLEEIVKEALEDWFNCHENELGDIIFDALERKLQDKIQSFKDSIDKSEDNLRSLSYKIDFLMEALESQEVKDAENFWRQIFSLKSNLIASENNADLFKKLDERIMFLENKLHSNIKIENKIFE